MSESGLRRLSLAGSTDGSADARVLYVGDLGIGSTALSRGRALAEIGLSVSFLDTLPFLSAGNRLSRSFRSRVALGGPVIASLNRQVVISADEIEADWVWIDKGVWIRPETLLKLRE